MGRARDTRRLGIDASARHGSALALVRWRTPEPQRRHRTRANGLAGREWRILRYPWRLSARQRRYISSTERQSAPAWRTWCRPRRQSRCHGRIVQPPMCVPRRALRHTRPTMRQSSLPSVFFPRDMRQSSATRCRSSAPMRQPHRAICVASPAKAFGCRDMRLVRETMRQPAVVIRRAAPGQAVVRPSGDLPRFASWTTTRPRPETRRGTRRTRRNATRRALGGSEESRMCARWPAASRADSTCRLPRFSWAASSRMGRRGMTRVAGTAAAQGVIVCAASPIVRRARMSTDDCARPSANDECRLPVRARCARLGHGNRARSTFRFAQQGLDRATRHTRSATDRRYSVPSCDNPPVRPPSRSPGYRVAGSAD